MRTIRHALVTAVVTLGASPQAGAEGIGVFTKIGTLGVGVGVGQPFGEHWAGRIGLNGLNYDRDTDIDDVDYDGELRLRSLEVLADWFPFASGFRVSGGLLVNGNEVELNANPGRPVEIGGVTYSPAQVGSLTAEAEFNRVAP